ncbi:MAG: 3-deoxy-D-manno-octulosonic acid transferase [Thiotrichales bacterium]|nr:3-deoxy-D-manno-octulosonic acid transferase [Thiotrichales bacterium]
MIYQTLIRVLSPVVILLTLLDGIKRKAEKTFLLKRFSFFLPKLAPHPKRLWIHCASVGEVKAADPLLRWLINSKLDTDILVTTNTASALAILKRQYQNQLNATYCPLDYPFAIRRFLARCNPSQLFIIETEIWPNLYQQCFQNNIPIHILSGRLSDKTLHAPSWLKKAYRQALQHVTQVLARSTSDAKNFILLGANADKVQVLGNLKFAHRDIEHFENPIGREYVLIASTHQDEERHIIQQWKKLKRPELLVVVPRHPNRSKLIQKSLLEQGCEFKVASKQHTIEPSDTLFLDDRIGFLMPLYEHAKLVIMGGSFVPKGGHNFIEPARYKKPIITGPDIRNFQDEFQLLKSYEGIIQCHNLTQLNQQIQRLLENPNEAETLGKQAYQAIQTQQDTLCRYLSALQLDKKPY